MSKYSFEHDQFLTLFHSFVFIFLQQPPNKHADTFTILMRVRGDWSRKVADLFHSSNSCSPLPSNLYSKKFPSLYCPIVTESSQRTKNFSYVSSRTRYSQQTLSGKRVLNLKPAYAAPSSQDDSLCYMKSLNKSNSYSFTPKEPQRNLKPHYQSVFCNSDNFVHSEFLYANILLLKENTRSLPPNHGLGELRLEHIRESTKHSSKLDSKAYSKCPVHKHSISEKSFHKICPQYVHKNQKLQNDPLCHSSKNNMASQAYKCRSHPINSKSSEEEKKEHIIDVDSPLYPR